MKIARQENKIKVAVVGRNLAHHFYQFLESEGYLIHLVPENTLSYMPVNNHPDLYGTQMPEDKWLLEPTLYETLEKRFSTLDANRFFKGEKTLGESYPKTCYYNHLVLKNRLLGCETCLHPQVITMAKKSGLKLEYVKQGYVRCTTAQIKENLIITSDIGINKRLNRLKEEDPESFTSLEVVMVNPKGIKLSGFSNGFIGGALIPIHSHLVYCYGNPKALENYSSIKSVLERNAIELIYSSEFQIEDIGSALLITL